MCVINVIFLHLNYEFHLGSRKNVTLHVKIFKSILLQFMSDPELDESFKSRTL